MQAPCRAFLFDNIGFLAPLPSRPFNPENGFPSVRSISQHLSWLFGYFSNGVGNLCFPPFFFALHLQALDFEKSGHNFLYEAI